MSHPDVAQDLVTALHNLEVAANTVQGCYVRNPKNFALALRSLEEAATAARATLEAEKTKQPETITLAVPNTDKIQYAFYLSGRLAAEGEDAEKLFEATLDAKTPAHLITTWWADGNMRGTLTICLSQISAKFVLENVDVNGMVEIPHIFMHENSATNAVIKNLCNEMLRVRDSGKYAE